MTWTRSQRGSDGRRGGGAGVRRTVGLAALLAVAGAAPAAAQIDPLLPLKRVPPNVIVVVDTSFPMLEDDDGNYRDPMTYLTADDPAVASALGVPVGASAYRRIYESMALTNAATATASYVTSNILATSDVMAADYNSFWESTRLEMAKAGIVNAVGGHPALVRWQLLQLRQNSPAWRSAADCGQPVVVTDNPALAGVSDSNPCPVGTPGEYGISAPQVAAANYAQAGPGAVTGSAGSSNAASIIALAQRPILDPAGLIPAGRDASSFTDRPITLALEDARALAVAAMDADDAATRWCRNTVVVLLAGGRDDGDAAYVEDHDPVATAFSFSAVEAGAGAGKVTRRVPIYVVGLRPPADEELQLMAIASASGGQYYAADSVTEVTSAINFAVQAAFQQSADLDAMQSSEYTLVSPIVGTVNLVGAKDVDGSPLPNTEVLSTVGATAGEVVPQRANMLLTAGFGLPGFDGRLRAFRTFKPEADATKPTGWRFVQDGTRLWPDLDGRPEFEGLARTPVSADDRNIYTFIPSGPGNGQMVAFTLAESGVLSSHLGGADPAVLIPFIRSQPLGAVVGSTPAIMDAPSLDPPPDLDYGFINTPGTFAGDHKDRRSIIFVGANDGMIHAIDARTGYEVWAFIPYNLLPKLRVLMDGQAVERFDYFVDNSPKIAEVKVGGVWKSMLIIGQGYGGTFYQAFDVTEAGMGVGPTVDGLAAVTGMLGRFDTPGESIDYMWSFPDYDSFDPNITAAIALADGFPGGEVRLFGDLKGSASEVEKRVGFTFSDPAVGPMTQDRSVTVVITGSGYFPAIETHASLARGPGAPSAGRSLFLLDVGTGEPIGAGGSCAGTGCLDVGTIGGGKNAVQADVTATGEFGSPVVTRAYVGDLNGRYFRFDLQSDGSIDSTVLTSTGQPIYSSSALLFLGSSQRFLFFSTGSDLLASTAPGGAGTFKLFGMQDSTSAGVPGTITFTEDLRSVSAASNLLTNGERPSSAPTVAGDIVFFTTTADASTASCDEVTANLYAFTFLGTGAYDANGNGTLDSNESPIVMTTPGRATAPFIVDQHLFMGVTSMTGAGVTLFGDPADFNNGVGQVGLRILSWREIR